MLAARVKTGMRKLRIVFMGTGDIALPTFRSLIEPGEGAEACELVALVTQPDKPVGRKQSSDCACHQAAGTGSRHSGDAARARQRQGSF